MIRSILLTLLGLGISVYTARSANFIIANHDVTALKQAILTSNTNGQADTITLWLKGTYTITSSLPTFEGETCALPEVWEDGNASNTLTILGNGAVIERDLSVADFRILSLVTGTLILHDLHIRNGKTALKNGSGIRNMSGTLKVYNCTLTNHTEAFQGGAVYTGASTYVLLSGCTITNCHAASGMAVFNYSGNIDLINCTIYGNTGRENFSAAVGSAAPSYTPSTTLVLYNTIVANNLNKAGTESDLSGAVISGSGNLIGAVNDVNTQNYFPAGSRNQNSDYVGTAASPVFPDLNPLGNYGGLTPAMSIQSASGLCYNKGFNFKAPLYDQAGNNRSGNADSGSMEFIDDFAFLNPHISVLESNTVIPHQTGSYTFPDTFTGSSSAAVTFTVKNTSTSTYKLVLLSSPAVFVSGDVADFTIVKDTLRKELEGMSAPITGFQIIFTPSGAGNKSITVSIPSNDVNTPVYEFTVNGTADAVTAVLNTEGNEELILSPNPSNGNFVVNNSDMQEGSLLRITELSGRILYEKEYTNGMPVNLYVSPGLYLLSIQKEEKFVVKKIVIE